MISFRQADLMPTMHKELKRIEYVDPTLINHKAQYSWYKYRNAIAWDGFPVNKLDSLPMLEVRLTEYNDEVLEHEITNRDAIEAFFKETPFTIWDSVCTNRYKFTLRIQVPK